MRQKNIVPNCAIRCAVVVSMLLMVGCSSPEEKSAEYYKQGMQSLDQGQLELAKEQLQNALKINDKQADAWYGLALIAEQTQDMKQLYRLLSQVVNIDPKHLQAQVKLGHLLLSAGQLDKAIAVADEAQALDAEDADVLGLRAALLLQLDDKAGAVEKARQALAKNERHVVALGVLATERAVAQDAEQALSYLEQALNIEPEDLKLLLMKARVLGAQQKLAEAEQTYRQLIKYYPDNKAVHRTLIGFLINHKRMADALAEFQAIADKPKATNAERMELVRFVASSQGMDAAIEQLQQLIANNSGNYELQFALVDLYGLTKAPAKAKEVLHAIAKQAGNDKDGLKAKGRLAAMKMAAGEQQEAQALVKEILRQDSRNEQGLLLKAGVEMQAGNIEQAIADLRSILLDSPDSARALLMLAQAHEREGSAALAREYYVKAFEAGQFRPALGGPYLNYLIRNKELERAAQVAEQVLRVTPKHIKTMQVLAQIRIQQGDFAAAQQMADAMRQVSGNEALAAQIEGTVQAQQRDYEQSIASFKQAYDASPNRLQPIVGLVYSYVQSGKLNEAKAFLDSVLRTNPDNLAASVLQGQLSLQMQNIEQAQRIFEGIIEKAPDQPVGYLHSARAALAQKNYDQADRVLTQGLEKVANKMQLQLLHLSVLQQQRRFDEAINVYEQLLQQRPDAVMFANNLASLLLEHKTDEASWQRAYELVKPFASSDVPQFKDTFGWASYKLNKIPDALQALKSAVKKLPEHHIVRYHLGMAYIASGDNEAGQLELNKALELAQGKPLEEVEQIKQALSAL